MLNSVFNLIFFYVTAADSVTLRNGKETNTQDYTETNDQDEAQGKLRGRRNGNVKATRGLQESWEWYDACYKRERNKGKAKKCLIAFAIASVGMCEIKQLSKNES